MSTITTLAANATAFVPKAAMSASRPTDTRADSGVGVSPATRLIDRDSSKFRSLKQFIVVGRPGVGTDGSCYHLGFAKLILTPATAIAEALRILKFKVYDFKAASDRHARDFPLWVEAARLRSEGKPYNKLDYDKVIGDHNGLVGAPTCFFDHDFVKLYPEVKVIMVTREPDVETIEALLGKLNAFTVKQVMHRVDAEFFGNISAFLELACGAALDTKAIRDTVRKNNLLELESFNSWEPLCDFLKVRVPKEAIPPMNDDVIATELARRPLLVLSQMVKLHGMKVVRGLQGLCAAAGVSLTANLLIEDARGATVLGFSVITLIAAWYWTNRTDLKALESPPSTEVVIAQDLGTTAVERSKNTIHGRHQNNRWTKGVQRRGQQSNRSQGGCPAAGSRPARPLLAGWANVEATIVKDDVLQRQERLKRAEEFEGKEAVFNETYSEEKDD